MNTLHADRPHQQNNRPQRRPFSQNKPKYEGKGHDAILKKYMAEGVEVAIMPISTGTEQIGTIIATDKYTITLRSQTGHEQTFFKHAIESFGKATG